MIEVNTFGRIRTYTLHCYILENRHFEHNHFLYKELQATICYFPIRFYTTRDSKNRTVSRAAGAGEVSD